MITINIIKMIMSIFFGIRIQKPFKHVKRGRSFRYHMAGKAMAKYNKPKRKITKRKRKTTKRRSRKHR